MTGKAGPSSAHLGEPAAFPTLDSVLPPAPRQCGRCRIVFPGDPSLDSSRKPGWWVCPPCRIALFGDEAATNRRWQRAGLPDPGN
jgi:hypothetical protein